MSSPAFVSDVGKVLIDFDFLPAARRLAEKCPHPAETVLRCFDDIKGPYEDGRMSDAEFVRDGMRLTGFTGTAEEFVSIWCEIFTENTPMRPVLASLAGKVPMYLLSNTSGLHVDYFWKTYDLFQHFDGGVYSHEARCSKPGEEIFRHTIEKYDLDPARTFYVDDLLPNIETAARMGFEVFHYSFAKHAEFEAAVAAWRVAQGIG
ncbi:MAG: HAD-IA family hydrolase [Verrucomicrobiaceae bacterium]|nr:HAD-IA family hydrolase [Verrucomicrobiaceae bacterium]